MLSHTQTSSNKLVKLLHLVDLFELYDNARTCQRQIHEQNVCKLILRAVFQETSQTFNNRGTIRYNNGPSFNCSIINLLTVFGIM